MLALASGHVSVADALALEVVGLGTIIVELAVGVEIIELEECSSTLDWMRLAPQTLFANTVPVVALVFR